MGFLSQKQDGKIKLVSLNFLKMLPKYKNDQKW